MGVFARASAKARRVRRTADGGASNANSEPISPPGDVGEASNVPKSPRPSDVPQSPRPSNVPQSPRPSSASPNFSPVTSGTLTPSASADRPTSSSNLPRSPSHPPTTPPHAGSRSVATRLASASSYASSDLTLAETPPQVPSGCPFHKVSVRRDAPNSTSERKYLAFSSVDIYLLPTSATPPPTTLSSFSLRQGGQRLQLDRLADSSTTMRELDEVVRPYDDDGPHAPAVRVVATALGDQSRPNPFARRKPEPYIITALSRDTREQWLATLRLRLAPWKMLRAEIIAAVDARAAVVEGRRGRPGDNIAQSPGATEGPRVHAAEGLPLLRAVGSSLSSDEDISLDMMALSLNGVDDQHMTGAGSAGPLGALRLGPVSATEPVDQAQMSRQLDAERLAAFATSASGLGSWFGSFSSAVAAVHNTAEPLAKTLGAFALIGPVIGVIAVSSQCAQMIVEVYKNRDEMCVLNTQIIRIASQLAAEALFILEAGVRGENFVQLMFNALEETWNVMADCERHLLDRARDQFWNVSEAAKIKERATEVERQLHLVQVHGRVSENSMLIRELQLQSSKETFEPGYTSIPNDSEYVVENALRWGSLEAILCDAGLDRVCQVAIRGPGGVGKTTACIRLANNLKTTDAGRSRYPGGIYYFVLGPSAEVSYAISRIVELVSISGGVERGRSIREKYGNSFNVEGAASEARHWLADQRILLIIDDAWVRPCSRNTRTEKQWAEIFASILSAGSSFLLSTRLSELTEFAGQVVELCRLGDTAKDAEVAEAIFDKHLCPPGARNVVVNAESRGIRAEMLEICNGLPLAIAICGIHVRRSGFEWREVLNGLQESILQFSGSAAIGNEGLAAVMERALRSLDSNPASSAAYLTAHELESLHAVYGEANCFTIMYASFVILEREKPRAPLHILARLWGLPGEGLAKKVCRLFKSFELVESLASCEWVEDRADAKMVVLHDLQRAHVELVCNRLESEGQRIEGEKLCVAYFHKKMMQNYCIVTFRSVLSPTTDWAKVLPPALNPGDTPDWYLAFDSNFERHAKAAVAPGDVFMEECVAGMEKYFPRSQVGDVLVAEDDANPLFAEDVETWLRSAPAAERANLEAQLLLLDRQYAEYTAELAALDETALQPNLPLASAAQGGQ